MKNALTSSELKNESCNETNHCHATVEIFCGSGETKFLVVHDINPCKEEIIA